MVSDLTIQEFDTLETDVINIVMFYGSECGPCKATMPHYEELSNTYNGSQAIKFWKFHQWENEDHRNYGEKTWQVNGVPTFKAVYNRETLHTKVGGGDAAAMQNFLQEVLNAFAQKKADNSLLVKLVKETGKMPEKAHVGDLGYDLFAAESRAIFPGETALVSTGIAVQFPKNWGGMIKDRSSMATKRQLFTVAGVIDNGYTGEIQVALHNATEEMVQNISVGDKIAQLVLIPVTNFPIIQVNDIMSSDMRGEKGFGSTGQ